MFGNKGNDARNVPEDTGWAGPQFEQRVLTIARKNMTTDSLSELLSQWGAQGWEIAGSVEGGIGGVRGSGDGDGWVTLFMQRRAR